MQCPEYESRKIVKNGRRKDKQNYLCRNCNRQFIENYNQRGYSQEMKRHCLILYCNGMGFRGIERSTGVCHNTVINWDLITTYALARLTLEIFNDYVWKKTNHIDLKTLWKYLGSVAAN